MVQLVKTKALTTGNEGELISGVTTVRIMGEENYIDINKSCSRHR